GRMQRLVKGAGRGGLFGLALAATGSKEVAKILDDTTSVIGDTLDLAVGGYKGLAAVLTGNQEALKNVRNEYRGTVNDFKQWASDSVMGAFNGSAGVDRRNYALLRAI